MTKYFIKYEDKAGINYIYLLCLYNIAQYNPKEKRYNTIKYTSLRDLQGQIYKINNYNISTATLTRILHDNNYLKYFEFNPKDKTIKLLNNLQGCNKFIVLNQAETRFLIEKDDNFLCKYFCYIRYYAGRGETDFTAGQFLDSCGYCSNSGNLKTKISKYNKELQDKGFIQIKSFYAADGKRRNLYSNN